MLTPERKDELIQELNKLKEEIRLIRENLNKSDETKEAKCDENDKIHEDFIKNRNEIKVYKTNRDALTSEVKALKDKRKLINDSIKEKRDLLSKILDEKEEIKKKSGIKNDPIEIMKKIEQIERKIETEAIPFETEKKLMKEIKAKKAELNQAKELVDSIKKAKTLQKDIRNLASEGKILHIQIQSKASLSQKEHEELVKRYQTLDQLRGKEKETYDGFVSAKTEFIETNKLLKEKIKKITEIQEELDRNRFEIKKEKINKEHLILAEKEKGVEEKIKKKQKLTVDDLLIYQKTNREN